MESYVSVIVLCEVLLTLFCVWGFLHEDKLRRWERAFFRAVIWTLWERFAAPVIVKLQEREG